jgi:hypothetical protein
MKIFSIFIFIFVSQIYAQYAPSQQQNPQNNNQQNQPSPNGQQQPKKDGGKQGCVVTDRILFINGIKDHTLSADEMQELQDYNTALQAYKDQLKQIQQFKNQIRQYQAPNQMNGNQPYQQQQSRPNNQVNPNQGYPNQGYPNQGYQNQGYQQSPQGYQQQPYNNNNNYRQGRQANPATTAAPSGMGSEQLVDPDNPITSTLMPNLTMPDPPTKPLFCSQNDTTQYFFDSCMVQGGKVYVGDQYARALTSDELTQLSDYDTKLAEYKNQTQTYQPNRQNQYGMNRNYQIPQNGQNPNQGQPQAPTPPQFCEML